MAFTVIDGQTKQTITVVATRGAAERIANRKNAAYGAHRYFVRAVAL